MEGQRILWFVDREPRVTTQQPTSTVSKLFDDEFSTTTHSDSTVFASKMVSELRVTTSYTRQQLHVAVILTTAERRRTFIGVMIDSTRLELSSRTPFKMLISSSRSGSSPVRWNCRKDLSSAFLYVCISFLPRT